MTCNTATPEGPPSAVLDYLRGRIRDANTKEALRATKLWAPSGVHASANASATTKLSNRIHSEVLKDESHVACLESLKDKFGLLTSAITTPGLLKCFLNALYVRKGGCDPYATWPGDVMMYNLQCVCPQDGLVLPCQMLHQHPGAINGRAWVLPSRFF